MLEMQLNCLGGLAGFQEKANLDLTHPLTMPLAAGNKTDHPTGKGMKDFVSARKWYLQNVRSIV